VYRIFFRVYIGCGVKLTTHLLLLPRLIINGSLPLLPYTPSRRGQGKIYLTSAGNKNVTTRSINVDKFD
jgi:hypothetical protein